MAYKNLNFTQNQSNAIKTVRSLVGFSHQIGREIIKFDNQGGCQEVLGNRHAQILLVERKIGATLEGDLASVKTL